MIIKVNKNVVLVAIFIAITVISIVIGFNILLKHTTYQVAPWEKVSVIYELDDETQMEVTNVVKIIHYETIQRVDIYYDDMDGEYSKTSVKTWQIQYVSGQHSANVFAYILRGK